MSRKLIVWLKGISQVGFLFLLFSVPLTILPWTSSALELNKQVVFVFVCGIAVTSLVIAHVLERQSFRRPGIFALTLIAFLGLSAMSAGTSLAPMTSWLGQGAQEYASVLTLFCFLGFVFLTQELQVNSKVFERALFASFGGSAVVVSIQLLTILGVSSGVFGGLVGTPHATAVYLLTFLSLICGLTLVGFRFSTQTLQRVFIGLGVFVFTGSLLLLLVLDSPTLWWLALAGSGITFLIALVHAERFQSPARFVPSMLLSIIAIIFLLLPTRLPSPFLREVSPNFTTTLGITTGAWNEGSVFFGSGPGTFSLVYPKYVPLDVNQSAFWDVIFDRGNAHVTTLLATYGLFGALAWIFLVLVVFGLAGRRLYLGESTWLHVVPVFVAWFMLAAAAFVYPQNFTLSACFWWLTASVIGQLSASAQVQHSESARARLATILVAIFVLVCAVSAFIITVPRYLAEVAYAKAVRLDTEASTPSEIDEVVSLLDKAGTRNPRNDAYYRNLSAALLKRLQVVSAEEAADDSYVQSLLAATIAASTRATEISPANVLNWDVRGMVYRDVLSVVPDAAEPSVDAYEMAIILSPTNPRYRVEVARAYLGIADAQNPLLQNEDKDVAAQAKDRKEEALRQAEEHLATAVALKPDYAPAQYYLALVHERMGDLAEAIRGLETVRAQAPQDVGVGFQLGLLYLRQGKNELAQMELQRVIELAPEYANAHWYLSVVYEQQGNMPAAIREVETVLTLNPDDVTVQARIDRLRAGQTNSGIPEPITPL